MKEWVLVISIIFILFALGFISGYKYRHEQGVTYRYIYVYKY